MKDALAFLVALGNLLVRATVSLEQSNGAFFVIVTGAGNTERRIYPLSSEDLARPIGELAEWISEMDVKRWQTHGQYLQKL